MSQDLVQISVPSAMSKDKIALIKRQIAKDATDDELSLFIHYCQAQGFDPLDKDVYFTKRNSKNGPVVTYVTSIDAFRARAEDTGQYAGNDDPVFDNEDTPNKASVTVYKIVNGVRCPFTASARWSQYYPGDAQGFMWKKMPHLMLGKCAEALALRKAFPKQLKKLYVKEEMEQAGPEQSEPKQIAKPVEVAEPIKKPKAKGYDGSTLHQEILKSALQKKQVAEELWGDIDAAMMGKSFTALDTVVMEVMSGN